MDIFVTVVLLCGVSNSFVVISRTAVSVMMSAICYESGKYFYEGPISAWSTESVLCIQLYALTFVGLLASM